jgi:hypothetical protein
MKEASVHSMVLNMRPHISKILEVEECLKYFGDFCKHAFIYESLECILEIHKYFQIPLNDHAQQTQKLDHIVERFLDADSMTDVNLPAPVKLDVLKCKTSHPEKVRTSLGVVKDELAIILGYRVPHFTQSIYWYQFIQRYPNLVTKCLNDIDQEKWKQIRYDKRDFMRDRFTDKEVLLCELMKEDTNIFKLQRTDLDGALSVYLWDGKDFLDEEDIGMGKFQGFKVAGSLPFPPWLVLTALASSKFHANIWQGYRFDREYDFRYIPSLVENDKLVNYDTHISKLVADYGKLLEYRSSYCLTENLYKDNRTYMLNKTITPHDGKYTPNTFKEDMTKDIMGPYEFHDISKNTSPYINMKGRKKCIHNPIFSLFIIQPLGTNQSLFSYINLVNPGGVLLSKLGTPEKRLIEIANMYRESMIREINNLLAEDHRILKTMKSVYDMVQTRLDRYKSIASPKSPHVMEQSFENQLKNLNIR